MRGDTRSTIENSVENGVIFGKSTRRDGKREPFLQTSYVQLNA